MKKLISMLLAIAILLCFAACNDTPPTVPTGGTHNALLDTLIAIRYRGEAEKLTGLAPQEYWDWYEGRGMKVSDLITYSEGAYYSWVNVMGGLYGENLTVSYSITAEKALDKATQDRYAAAMEEKYGIDADTVKNGKELTVEMTISGSLQTETTESKFTMITIGDKDYLIRVGDENGEFTITFQFY